tara:strand:- start:39 stop:290 length:252 start_codon:yes stop_codon:yes gene_type:complete
MALKVFKDKVAPHIGDLVRPKTISDLTGIVIAIKENEDDVDSEYYKSKPRKIFIVRWISNPHWARAKIKTDYFSHQLEVVSKA